MGEGVQRNFQGYTSDDAETLIGLGASSIGSLPQGYVQNQPSLASYKDAVQAGHLPIVKGRSLSEDDRERRDIINDLMCTLRADLAGGRDHYQRELKCLEPLMDDGLVELQGDRLVVTEEGRPLVRVAAAAFDTYLANEAGRHSKAV